MKKILSITLVLLVVLVALPTIMTAQETFVEEEQGTLSVETLTYQELNTLNERLSVIEDQLDDIAGFSVEQIIIIALIVVLIIIGVAFKIDVSSIVKFLLELLPDEKKKEILKR